MSHIRGTHGQVHLSRRRRPETDRSTASYAHNSRPQQRKGEDAANPSHGSTISPTMLTCQKACQLLIKHISLSTHTSSGRKHQNETSSTSRTLSPYSFFYYLLTSIHSRDIGVLIASCIRVKNPYIEKGTLPATPESTSMYISSSIIFPISSGWNNILTRKWLQWRLNNNIMTYTIKPLR